jgi:DNA polymerase III alpha subunit
MGLTVLPACVNHSRWAWTGRERELRVGLCQVRGLRQAAGEALIEARGETPFASFEDLARRVPGLERADLTLLARAGALDALEDAAQGPDPASAQRPANRARLHWRIALLSRRAHAGALFGEVRASCPAAPEVPDLDPDQRLEQELLAYGLPITCHPLELWAPGLDAEAGLTPACEVPKKIGQRVRVVGWLVTAKLVQTKRREAMEFLTLEDRTGLVDVTAFPRVYARAAGAIHAPRPVVVSGRVEEELGVAAVVAERIRSWWGPCRIAEPSFAADVTGEDLLE